MPCILSRRSVKLFSVTGTSYCAATRGSALQLGSISAYCTRCTRLELNARPQSPKVHVASQQAHDRELDYSSSMNLVKHPSQRPGEECAKHRDEALMVARRLFLIVLAAASYRK